MPDGFLFCSGKWGNVRINAYGASKQLSFLGSVSSWPRRDPHFWGLAVSTMGAEFLTHIKGPVPAPPAGYVGQTPVSAPE